MFKKCVKMLAIFSLPVVTDSYLFLPCSFKGETVYLFHLSLEGIAQSLEISSRDWKSHLSKGLKNTFIDFAFLL